MLAVPGKMGLSKHYQMKSKFDEEWKKNSLGPVVQS